MLFMMFILFCLSFLHPSALIAEGEKLNIEKILFHEHDSAVDIVVKGAGKSISTIYELPNPERVVVDIANAELANNFSNEIKSNFIQLQTKEIKDSNPPILRLELLVNQKKSFELNKTDDDIKITITKSEKSDQPVNPQSSNEVPPDTSGQDKDNATSLISKNKSSSDKISGVIGGSKNIENQLPEINPLNVKPSPKAKAQQMEDAFNFSGYNKERITVEFQKMDLHNVFNFLRQVSGVNIVVDESVQGVLTLVLDDVPWDFALDIILNLKDLEKEERFNTLVIYPKDKGFKWPDQAQNNLSFQADSKVVEHESLIIKQQEQQPVESVEAKEQMALAREAEKKENFETAIQYYEKALEKWPSNSKLANKISSIYLVQLRQNAKALYYAKIALEKDRKNYPAMLNAAIASANMQDKEKARIYFNQCTQSKKPAKEALLSYAVFSEEQQDFIGALQHLERHDTLYGDDLNSLIAVARIYDKMGKSQQSTDRYQKVLLSGYSLPPDLEKYIKGRLSLKQAM
jgi:type IV pilus assembly protein PilQ